MACVKKITQKRKPTPFSEAEIEAARQLIQLGSAGSGIDSVNEDHHSTNNSYSVQWKPQKCKADTGAAVSLSSSDAIEDVLAEIEEDERLRRRNKRYRYIQDLYNVTKPLVHVPEIKANMIKFTK